MKINRISYSESRESISEVMGLKTWKRFGIEADVEEGESIGAAYHKAEGIVRDLMRQSGYSINDIEGMPQMLNSLAKQPIPSIDYKAKEKVEKAIDDAAGKEQLMQLQNEAIKYDLVKQYINKLQSFQK